MSLMMDGTAVGSTKIASGTVVELVELKGDMLRVKVGAAEGEVAIVATDFVVRQAQLAAAPPEVKMVEDDHQNAVSSAQETPVPKASKAETRSASDPLSFEFSADPRGGAYEVAQFQCWLAEPETRPRGVLVLVPGANGDGRKMATDQNWQQLAQEFHLLIVACFLKGGNYQNPEGGSGEALYEAIAAFGEKAGMDDLEKLPFVMWGHSAGGQFNYNFVQWEPKQVLAFVVNKGAYYTSRRDKKSHDVPGLFFIGMKDKPVRVENITGIYLEGREDGAPWCLVRESTQSHGIGDSRAFSMEYFRSIIPLRLSTDSGTLNSIDVADGWLGELKSHEVVTADDAEWEEEDTSWLPNKALADRWKEIVSKR